MRSSSLAGGRGWAVAVLTACALGLAACGSGGSGSAPAGNSTPAAAQNVLPIVVDAGPAKGVNVPFVAVTICAPGSSNCQTIDHVIVDTGSTGLRIMSSVLNPSLALTQQTTGNGAPLVECTQFADGYVWGPVKKADLRLGGEAVNSVALQVIGDPGYGNVPSDCSSAGPAENSVQAFGGNGILGVGAFQQDCGPVCAQAATPGTYYACAGAACQAVAVDLAHQVQNPVGLLSSDNNGVVIDLPAVAATGAATVDGSLILGIGTQSDNALGSAQVFALDPSTGTLTTVFNGRRYAGSFIDSGSNALFFPDGGTAVCSSGFYCPASPQQFTATNQGSNGSSGSVDFTVANADSLLATGNTAFSNLAGPSSGIAGFDWGLSFHFGRRVYTAIEGRSTPGGSGPYAAY
ncbi:MAG TPA: DUF3443 domain-containing protein [Rhodocyclaceae bacterium]|nr:DUF3443 domain-containing protein [Rhodocyclaceae bacterium]